MAHPHPYYPIDIPIPLYRPSDQPLAFPLLLFVGLAFAVIFPVYHVSSQTRRRLRGIDRFAACWFALCSFSHIIFEGYYVLHHDRLASMNTLLAQLWKEYTLSDSRYLTSDLFTLCIETITMSAIGPLSLMAVLTSITSSPSRHIYRLIVCVAHVYGVALYFATNWAESRFHGVQYSRPEFLYFWVYYVGFNSLWAVVPLYLMGDSCRQIVRAFEALPERESLLRRKKASDTAVLNCLSQRDAKRAH